jgi:hypothetical protein
MNEQSANSVGGASNGTDFQPPTQNPQSNVNSSLQTTDSGLQMPTSTTNNLLLNSTANILVPTANGTVAIAPTSTANLATHPTAKNSPVATWLGVGLVLVLLGIMAVGLLKPRKY